MQAQSSDHAKILDIQGYSAVSSSTTTDPSGVPVVTSNTEHGFTITVRIDDIIYSGEFHDSRKLHPSDFVVGDTLKARIDGNKMFVTSPANREVKGKLIRRQHARDAIASGS
jgi:hypothetical protein